MADLHDIVGAAFATAEAGETPDTLDTDTGDPDPVADPVIEPDPAGDPDPVDPDPADTSVDPDPDKEPVVPEVDPATGKPKVEEKPVEKDELTKELEALGLKEPKEGERENRLPFKRVKKITENYGKKVAAKYEAELAPLKTEVEGLRQVKTNVASVDRLIATDADRYITMLAGIHPEYKKFLTGGKVEGAKLPENKAVTDLGPRPAADVQFEDKSMGYSPEQHDKLLDWVAAKARAEAVADTKAELDKRFKPMDDEREAREAYNKRVEGVRSEANQIREAYGADVVKKFETQIVEHMKKNPTMTATRAAREVIIPALQADRNKIRTEVLVETGERKAAAAKTPASASSKKAVAGDGPRSLEDVVREAVATIK